jgi:hypothetical protein
LARQRKRIPAALRRRVIEEANHRCSYCLGPEIAGVLMAVDHILPVTAGGPTKFENLCLACYRCNEFKGARVDGRDPLTGAVVPLFNPRALVWREHFAWTADGLHLLGLTTTGRATIEALRLNDDWLIRARRIWIIAGLHPPLG